MPDVVVVGAGIIGCAIARRAGGAWGRDDRRRSPSARRRCHPGVGRNAGALHRSARSRTPARPRHSKPRPLRRLDRRRQARERTSTSSIGGSVRSKWRREPARGRAAAKRRCTLREPSRKRWMMARGARRRTGARQPGRRRALHRDARLRRRASVDPRSRCGGRTPRARVSGRRRFAVIAARGTALCRRYERRRGHRADRGARGRRVDQPDVGSAAAVPPLRPVRGQLLHLGWNGPPVDTILWGPECYIVPRLDGTSARRRDGRGRRVRRARRRRRAFVICSTRPASSCLRRGARRFSARACGLRPATPDDLPVIGPDYATAGPRARVRPLSQRRPARAADGAV